MNVDGENRRGMWGPGSLGVGAGPLKWAGLLVLVVMVGSAWGQEADSLDELLGLEEESAPAEAEEDAAAAEEGEEGEANAPDAPQLPTESDLDGLALPDAEDGDVFQLAVADMKTAAERLGGRRDASIDTQRVQQRVIDRLDQVISMARRQQQEQNQQQQQQQQQDTGSQQNQQQQQQQQQADAQQQSSEAARDERATRGTAERGDMEDQPLNERLSEWGNLPPRLRDQLMQGMDDEFSQLYRQLTERYYERLAEQQQ